MFFTKKPITKKFFLLFVAVLFAGFLFFPQKSQAAENDTYPKLANYFTGWDLTNADIGQLAKWDLVILTPQAVERQPKILTTLRQKNPRIKILVYVLMEEINNEMPIINASPFYQQIYQKVNQNNWWLKTADGQHVAWWPKTWMINVTNSNAKEAWNDFLPQLVYNNFLTNNDWDGVFFDNVWDNVSWLNKPIDTNNDSLADSPALMDQRWQEGITKVLTAIKKLAPDKIIVINANSNNYNNLLNGRMKENFPNQSEGYWTGAMKNYLTSQVGYQPQYYIINSNTKNTGSKDDYRNFRFGLTSTLLGNGYYSFDYGDQGHTNVWWFDEYNFFLGKGVSDPKNLLAADSKEVKPGVWQRDFQNALVIVNSTEQAQKINFDEEYEKIKGSQDTSTNNGSIVKSLTLKAHDGVILLRRIEEIKNTPYYNGSFVRAFNKLGDSVRNGFFIYDKQFKGNTLVAKKDINKDGRLETISADLAKISIFDANNILLDSFYPYGQAYNKGLNFAITDFENDGFFEIVTGTMRGYAPLVKVFNYKGEAQGEGFYAYAKTYLGGVNVAAGDTNGNGQKEIVTGAGYMGGPQVRIFDKNGKILSGGFFAYSKDFRGGVNVACGDIDGNGIDEIVTGAGYGGSSHVRYFNSKFQPLSPGFWAFGKNSKTGVRVFLNDLDGDGKQEILAASPDTFTTAIK
ncbi:MAG: putative glycoside hydrolase [Patescibacteria group bacterium]